MAKGYAHGFARGFAKGFAKGFTNSCPKAVTEGFAKGRRFALALVTQLRQVSA